MRAQTICQPHERRRRFTVRTSELSLSQPPRPSVTPQATAERLNWLENELLRVLDVDVRQVSTGIALDSLPRWQDILRAHHHDLGASRVASAPAQRAGAQSSALQSEEDESPDVDPNISLLAFNATGGARYLGASSGSIFARFIANTARSILPPGSTLQSHVYDSRTIHRPTVPFNSANWRPSAAFDFLLRCFLKWVHSCYPLFLSRDITTLKSMSYSSKPPPEAGDMTVIFYLVMSIGAVHAEQHHLLDHFQDDTGLRDYQNDASAYGVSSEALYRKAIGLLASEPSNLNSRISLVQILNLISIYASHRPSDNEQWHIAGMAMRVCFGTSHKRQGKR